MKKFLKSLLLVLLLVCTVTFVGCNKKDKEPENPDVPPIVNPDEKDPETPVDPEKPTDPEVKPGEGEEEKPEDKPVEPEKPEVKDNWPYAVDKAYKLSIFQTNEEINKPFYFTGEMAGYYFATTDDITKGVDVYCEKVEGGYKLYFLIGEEKNYIAIVKSADGKHINAVFGTDKDCTFTWDEEYKTMVTKLGEDRAYFYVSSAPNKKTGKVYTTIAASTYTPGKSTCVATLVENK